MAKKNFDVIVVGGSLAGLFSALILKRLGHTVHILECNATPHLHSQGAGLVNRNPTQEFLRLHDTTNSGKLAVMCNSVHILDVEGIDIFAVDAELEMRSWDCLYWVLRANFDGVENGVVGVREMGMERRVEVGYLDPEGRKQSVDADLVIAADGPSSTVRAILQPDIERKYAGYVAWRGTVPENLASLTARSALVDTYCFYYGEDSQVISYTIPGVCGTLEPGKRLINWAWYVNYPKNSNEFEELMTDVDGKRHRVTMPVGKMRPEILEQQRVVAKKNLPPQFAEMVCKTAEPFVQCVTDVLATENSFFNGKVLLSGDAAAGFRPHTSSSTSYAAFCALKLSDLLCGSIGLQQWSEATMTYAREVQAVGVEMGEVSQFRKVMSLSQKMGKIVAAQKRLPGNLASKAKVWVMVWGLVKYWVRGLRRALRERLWRLVGAWRGKSGSKRE